ncbi:hypothetical protein N0V85_008118 [Neurospora sp. IMI 360204]|nr:hypothetical protein N0V85_008118 [Neurospora sp. IMI 360204]
MNLNNTPDTTAPISSSLCTSFLSRDKSALLLPNARIPLSPAGFIDCFLEPHRSQAEDNQHQNQQLVFTGIPAGWQFSITDITVAGWLDLERGSFVERVSVDLVYPELLRTCTRTTKNISEEDVVDDGLSLGGSGKSDKGLKLGLKRELRLQKTRRATQATQPSKSQSQGLIDTATALTPYGRFGTGYQGTFNLSMPVKPGTGKGKRDQLALSPCSTGPEMEIALGAELWFSLSHEQIDFDDTIVHRGRLGGEEGDEEGDDEKTLRVGVTGRWARC